MVDFGCFLFFFTITFSSAKLLVLKSATFLIDTGGGIGDHYIRLWSTPDNEEHSSNTRFSIRIL